MTHSRGVRAIYLAAAAVIALILISPILVLVSASFSSGDILSAFPDGLSLRWYESLFNSSKYVDQIVFTIIVALIAATTSLVLGVLAALALGRSRSRWAEPTVSFLMSPLIVPQVVIGAALLQYFGSLGLQGNVIGLLLGHVVITVPYVMRTVISAVVGVNGYLIEASMDLGATRGETYRLIVLPLIRTPAIAGWLFAFVMSWINVELSIFLAPGDLATTPVEIFNYIQYSVDPLIAAYSSVSAYLALVMVIFIDRLIGIERIAK